MRAQPPVHGPALRGAVVQLPGAPGPVAARLAWAEAALERALRGGPGPRVVVFPEAALPGYAPGLRGGGPAAAAGAAWARAAARRSGAHIAIGLAEDDVSHMILVAPSGAEWRYPKRYPTFAEAPHWRAGAALTVAHTALGRVGLAICADVVQPGLWAGLRGRVDLVVVSAAWCDYQGRLSGAPAWRRAALGPWMGGAGPHRDRLLAAAAAALGVPVLYANACGPYQGAERFEGGSRILGPEGEVLAEVGAGGAAALGGAGAGLAAAALPPARGGPPRPLQLELGWRAFAAAHRWAARARAASRAPAAPAAAAVQRSMAMIGKQAAAKAGPSSAAK